MNFNKLHQVKKYSTEYDAMSDTAKDAAQVMLAADRSYMTGNYLEDFLQAHGREGIRDIIFLSGNETVVGTGIVFSGPCDVYDRNNNFVEEYDSRASARRTYSGTNRPEYSFVELKVPGECALPWTYSPEAKYEDKMRNVRSFGSCDEL